MNTPIESAVAALAAALLLGACASAQVAPSRGHSPYDMVLDQATRTTVLAASTT